MVVEHGQHVSKHDEEESRLSVSLSNKFFDKINSI